MKKCIDQVYSTYLPKNNHPFIYLSLELDPGNIDVNVHPTKHEVHFLSEEQIVESICSALETKLLNCNNSRIFYTQAKLPGVQIETLPIKDPANRSTKNDFKVNPKDLVRTDAQGQKLDKFFGGPVNKNDFKEVPTQSKSEPLSASFISKITRIETELKSVLELLKTVEENGHKVLRDVFAQHVFVGSINPMQALIQYSTKLYLCNTKKIFYELLYQFIVYNFQNFHSFVFSQPLPLYDLALQGLNLPEVGWNPDDGNKDDLAKKITEILTEKGEMLNEYFSMDINEKGELLSIPLLLGIFLGVVFCKKLQHDFLF